MNETCAQVEVNPATLYLRKFAYLPLRLDGRTVLFSYFYENLEGEKISQRTFLTKRLKGSATLYHLPNKKKNYFLEKIKGLGV